MVTVTLAPVRVIDGIIGFELAFFGSVPAMLSSQFGAPSPSVSALLLRAEAPYICSQTSLMPLAFESSCCAVAGSRINRRTATKRVSRDRELGGQVFMGGSETAAARQSDTTPCA